MTLKVRYDDGFVAYLNGAKIAEDRAPDPPLWDSVATMSHGDADAVNFVSFDVSSLHGLARRGRRRRQFARYD